jgi:hypothetical protein
LSHRDLAKKLGKSHTWVDNRIKLAMNLHDAVAKALDEDKISTKTAEIISTLNMATQLPFLLYILENKITNVDEVRKAKKRFLNNTIYTIGYESRQLSDFIEVLKKNEIEHVLDVLLC